MKEILADLQLKFKNGDVIIRLIYINGSVFLTSVLFSIIWGLFTGASLQESSSYFVKALGLPTNNFFGLLVQPYTLVSHMFLHVDFFHILFNLLLLYFLGQLFLNYFSQKQLLGLYLLGGLIGAGGLIITTNLSPLFPPNGVAYGASAAVMAVAIGIIAYTPNTKVMLFGMFPVKLLWIGAFYVLSDLVYFYDSNTGGHIAHLIGAGTGYWFAASFKQGKDITLGINKLLNTVVNLFKPKSKMKVVYNQSKVRKMTDEEYNETKKITQQEIDKILDKISASGYDSLTKREKEILFKHSRKN